MASLAVWTMLAMLVVPVVQIAVAAAPAAAASGVPVTSADGKLTLTKTASPTSLPYGGGTVTYTYTVKNNTAGRMYYGGLSDNKCRPSYVSGMSYSWFSGDYIPAGGTATFSCTQRITTDTTNTATASFSNVSGIQSSVSATATVTVARPATGNTSCDFIYASTVYLSGTNGTGSVSIWPNATGIDMPTSYTVGGVVADSSTALAIDPLNPNTAYLTLRTEDGVYYPYLMKVDLSTGIWTRIDVTNSTPAAWGSNRLAVDRYGHVWSLANDGVLFEYDPVAGTTTTHGIPRTLTATNPDGTSVTIDFGTLSSGDIAFDGDNNLWILAANGTTNTTYLVTIPYASLDAGTGTTRTTGPTATYLGTVTNPANGGYYNGLAFATNGTLYASNYSGSTSYLYTLNSATGASTLVGTGVALDGVIGDLASCAIPKPNLLVTKTADKDLVQAGEQITYTVKITNTSPLASTGTTFVDPLPANTTYVSSTFNGTAITGTTNPWQSAREVHGTSTTRAGLLPGGDTATITITVKVNSPLPAGTTNILNQGTADYTGNSNPIKSDDPTLSGSTDPTTTGIIAPSISLDKTADKSAIAGSGLVTYTYAVSNTGNVAITTPAVTDDKCSPLALKPADQTALTGDLDADGVLDVGEVWYYTCATTLTWTSTNTSVTNTATATGKYGTTNLSATDTWTVTLSPAPASINVSKTAGAVTGPDASGTYSVTYTVSVRNTGQTAGSYGPITDTPQFSSNLTATGATWVGQSSGSATGSGPYSIGAANTSLAAGGTHTYTVTVTFKFATFTAATACGGAGTGLYNSASLPAGQEQGATTDNSACVTPPPPPAPAITLTKSAGPINDLDSNGHDPGDTIAYSFTVKSTGNTPLGSITLTDAKCDTGTLTRTGGDTNSDSVLQATETWTYTCTHTLTAADITAGSVVNTASASGTFAGTAYTATATTTTTIAKPAITLDKQTGTYVDTNVNGRTDAGDTMTYNFVVVNTGNTSLTNISLTDPKLTAAGLSITCPTSTLAAGESMTCTSTAYTFTTADQTAGTFTNTASVTGVPPSGPSVSATDPVTVTLTYAAISIVKSEASRSEGTDGRLNAGDTITYQFVVTNTGQVPLTGVTISDPKLAGVTITCPSTSLGSGASMTCTAAAYTVTAADQTTGRVVNVASVSGTPPTGTNVTSSSTIVTPVQYAAVDFTKVIDQVIDLAPPANGIIDRGDQVIYNFVVTNAGTIPLNTFAVSDPLLAAAGVTITCPAGPLAPGVSVTCVSGPYSITQQQQRARLLSNTASVTAQPTVGAVVTDTDSTSLIVSNPEVLLTKTAGSIVDVNGGGAGAGDKITYTFTVTNPDNTNETNVVVSDPLCDALATRTSGDVNNNNVLEGVGVGSETWTFSCVHTITQAEVDAGVVLNTATVSGKPTGNTPPVTSPPDSASTPIPRAGGIAMTKAVASTTPPTSPFTYTAVGQSITYQFAVTNTGNVSLSGVSISDAKCNAAATLVSGDTDADNQLDVIESWVFQCVHTVTQADLDNLEVVNTATASGTTPMGTTQTSTPSTATVNASVTSGMTIDKLVGSQSANPISAVGQTITYDFVVDNTGTTSLSSVSVTDSRCTTTLFSGDTNADGKLQPNELWIYRCTYSVTQADLDAGSIVNTATAKGTPSGSATPITSTPDSVTVVTAAPGAMSITKTGSAPTDIDGDGLVEPGDTIAYGFTVANTGSVALSSVQVVDDRCTTTPARTTGDTDSDGKLDVTETWTFTCTKTLTAADISAGTVHNTAYAQGATPGGTTVTSPNATFDTTIPQVARLTLDKALATPASPVTDLDGNGPDAGDSIAYTFSVTNTGNVTLAPVTLTDSKLGLTGTQCVSSLAPGATVQCTGTFLYTISVAESNAGSVLNTATATGTPAMGAPATATDTVTATFTPIPAIHLEKSGQARDVDGDGILKAGVDTIVYSFTVTNTGGVTLNGVHVTDPALTTLSIACSPATIDPGQTATCSAARFITSADFTLTYAANTATAHGTPVTGAADITDDASATTPVLQQLIALQKTAAAPTVAAGSDSLVTDANDTITYTFTVTNTGNVDFSSVALTDPKCDVTPTVGALAVGASTTVTCLHTITAAEDLVNLVENTASVTGQSTSGPATSTDTTSTPLAGIAVTKDVNKTSAKVGDTLTYTITVVNTGAVAYTPAITDTECVGLSPAASLLSPGGSAVFSCTHLLEATDPDPYVNTVYVTGDDGNPATTDPSANDAASTAILAPAITVSKSVDKDSAQVGQTLTYTITVVNTGEVPYTPVITDAQCGAVSPTPVVLAVDTTATFTCTHTLVAADPKPYMNTVSVTGDDGDPVTTDVTGTAQASTTVLTPAMTVSKVVDKDSAQVGQTVTYTITVVNTGAVPYTPVLTDTQCAGMTPAASLLSPGGSAVFSCSHVLVAGDPSPYVNTVSVTGDDGDPVTTDVTGTAQASTTVLTPAMTVSKVVDKDSAQVGQTVTYTITVVNTGAVPYTPVLTDTQCAGMTPAASLLLPGGSAVFSCSHVLVAGDPSPYVNTVSVTGDDGDPVTTDVTGTAQATTTVLTPAMTVSKVVDKDSAQVGQTVTYTITVVNTGAVPYTPVLTDTQCAGMTPAASLLSPGGSAVFSCSHVLVAGDPSPYVNTVSVTGDDGDPVTTDVTGTAQATTTVLTPAMTVSKVVDKDSAQVGQTVTYTITVVNTGAVPYTPVLTDTQCAGMTPAASLLSPGGSAVFSCSHVLVAGDPSPYVNTVSVTGDDGDPVTTDVTGTAQATTTVLTPAMTVSKVVDKDSAQVGQTVTYTITVVNTGAVPYTPVLTDTQCAGMTPAASLLSPGGSAVFSCSHVLVAGDPSPYVNTVSVTGDDGDPVTTDVTGTAQASTTVLTPAMTVSKVVDKDSAQVGQTVTYTITVVNTGAVPYTPVLTDTQCAGMTPAASLLSPGGSAVFSCSHVLVAGDPSPYVNTVSVTGDDGDPVTTDVTGTAQASTTVLTPAMTVSKVVDKDSAQVGQTVTYTITVVNTGAVPYTPVLTDTQCAGMTPAASLLSPGGSAVFSCSHVLVAGDPSPYVNTVSVTGDDGDPVTTDVTGTAQATTTVLTPAMTVSKVVDKDSAQVGQTVTYTITVVNTGAVPYTPVLTDTQCAGMTPAASLLSPGGSAVFSCSHVLVAGDPSPYVNTVSVTGDDGDPVTTDVTGTAQATTTVLTPAMTVSKVVDKDSAQVGQTVTYTITVVNTGAVPYTPVLTDTQCAGMTPAASLLSPGGSAVFSCSHVLVAGDPSPYVNTVSVTGDDGDPATTDVTGTAQATTTVLTSSIAVVKSADKASAQSGESITWTITVNNTGGVPLQPSLADVVCVPALQSGDGDADGWLDSTETWTYSCTSSMPATGDASNTVDVSTTDGITGTTDPTGTGTDTVTPLTSSIEVLKSADRASAQPGEIITWTATVQNTGQVALTVNPPTDTVCPGITRVASDANGLLDPGETWTYRCTTTMGGSTATNTFSVTTTDGIIGTTDPTGSATATVSPLTSSIAVTKVADRSTAQPGETITWTVTVQNTGAVPLTPTMDDAMCSLTKTGGDAVNVGVLDPAETWTYRCTTTMGAAKVTNVVTVTTDDGINGTTDPQRSEQATVNVLSSTILVKKTADKTVAQLGETVTWTLTVENTGQVGLTPTAADPLCTLTKTGGDTANVGVLDPGEKWTYQCTTTMGDASVTNIATVTTSDGIAATTDPQGEDSANVNYVDSGIAVQKVADKSAAQPGETITWTVTVENTALVALTPTVDDPACTLTKTGGDLTNVGLLDPGEKWTYECTTTMGASAVTNTVTVTTDDGVPVTTDPQGTESATVNPLTSAILVKKSADKVGAQQGDTVTWTVAVENIGQVNLTPTVSDPMCTLTKTGGDTVNVGVLDPGEIWSYRCTTTMGGAPVTNTATVTTSDGITGTTDPGGADSATVNLLVSSVLVEKTADRVAAKPGQVITWTVRVTNNGQVPLTPTVQDPQCVLDAPIGDNGNGILDVGEAWTYLCTTTMGTADATNTVTVTTSDGNAATTDPTGSATDTVTCTPLVPAIEVTKVADKEIAQPGEPIVWTITVTNTGETPLTPTLQDPQGTPTYVSGDADGNGVLDIGETWVYSLTTTMGDATVSGPVTVVGDDGDPLTSNPQASAVDTVTLVSQHMTVHKTSDKQVYVVGDTVIWTVTITNDGEVAITPSLSDPMGTPTLGSGDTNGNGVLDVGETWVYTYTSVVSSAGDVANTVAVATTDGNTYTTDVTGVGTRTITVVPEPSSSISVDKSADRSAARAGERITWTIAVTNTGQTVLNPTVSDSLCTDLRLAGGDANGNGRLDPGERFVYLCTSTMGGAAMTNTAQLTTTLGDGRPGPNASASATVRFMSSSAPLAQTGTDVLPPLLWSGFLMAAGVLLIAGAKRRRGQNVTI